MVRFFFFTLPPVAAILRGSEIYFTISWKPFFLDKKNPMFFSVTIKACMQIFIVMGWVVKAKVTNKETGTRIGNIYLQQPTKITAKHKSTVQSKNTWLEKLDNVWDSQSFE